MTRVPRMLIFLAVLICSAIPARAQTMTQEQFREIAGKIIVESRVIGGLTFGIKDFLDGPSLFVMFSIGSLFKLPGLPHQAASPHRRRVRLRDKPR